MSWIREERKSWIHSTITSVLRAGAIPRHVAFIMDGNRRFARKNNFDRAKGHLLGFDKLAETLEWCLDLGILEVTVYAFSIENFKRSKEEVDGLLELARQKFRRLMEDKELIHKHGVCFRVLGNISLLPRDIQQMIAEGVHMTRNNDRAILNVCFAYTSRDEMCHAVQSLVEGVQKNYIRESDIGETLFEKCLYTSKSSAPDLLIRTSGEVRLSDFLLWQSSYSPLSFMQVLWPEFSRWHLYAAIVFYQRQLPAILKAREANSAEVQRLETESDKDWACQARKHSTYTTPAQSSNSIPDQQSSSIPDQQSSAMPHQLANTAESCIASLDRQQPLAGSLCSEYIETCHSAKLDNDVELYRSERLRRIERFTEYLQRKDEEYFSELVQANDELATGK